MRTSIWSAIRRPYPGITSTSASTSSSPICTCRNFTSTALSSARSQDHYAALKLPRNASKQQIKAKFYELSKKYHPDAPGGSPSLFHTINDAYSTLSDDAKRQAYDEASRPTTGDKRYHPHSPQARRPAGPHRAWGRPPPQPQWAGGRKYDNLGWGMGMGGNMGGPAPQRGTYGRRSTPERKRHERERGEREDTGEGGVWRFVLVVTVLFGILALGGVTANAEGGGEGDGERQEDRNTGTEWHRRHGVEIDELD